MYSKHIFGLIALEAITTLSVGSDCPYVVSTSWDFMSMGYLTVLVLAFLCSVLGEVRQSLNGKWIVTSNTNTSLSADATVPGGIYTDLQNAGKLSDNLFYRFFDIELRWVSKHNWTYSITFQVSSEIAGKNNISLVFEGIDTVSTVKLNDQEIGSTDNMFARYSFPVKGIIKEGDNTLEVSILSPIFASQQLYDEQAANYVVPPQCVPQEQHGECHINHLRKMQASFSWDWGPAYPSVGIWKDVQLIAYDSGYIRDVLVTVKQDDAGDFQVDASIEVEESGVEKCVIGSSLSPTSFCIKRKTQGRDVSTTNITFSVPQEDVEMWWPNGFGSQKLYNMTIFYQCENERSEITRKFGYRSVSLVQERIMDRDDFGLTFYVKINGVPIFSKGSNWIPSHVLPEQSANEARIRNLLSAAKEANMNMLRVWGGGLYESDLFYEVADELGIMIWQDFMFACAMYPTTTNFLDSVKQEISYQVKRLSHHPSVVIWAGNNENEAALRDNWYGTGNNFELYKSDYIKLYVDTIRTVVVESDSSRPFVVSSPSNGAASEAEGYVAQNPYSGLYGDVHYYNYDADGWDSNTFPITRFASEYGFQSFPSLLTLAKIAEPYDLSSNSQLMLSRQHHYDGNAQIARQIQRHLPLPTDYDLPENFRTYIYYSQITQAMFMKAETEHYRRCRSVLTDSGQGFTMGALYWQLNDIWEAPSWASIDFHLRWKMIHYFAKNFFSSILVSPHVHSNGELRVSLISDLLTNQTVTLTIEVYRWDSFTPVNTTTLESNMQASSAYDVYFRMLDDALNIVECNTDGDPKNTCFLYFTLTSLNGSKISPDNFWLPGPLQSAIGLQVPQLAITGVSGPQTSSGPLAYEFTISLTTDNIAPFVWLEVDLQGHFSENGFLMNTPAKEVKFYTDTEATVENVTETLTVTSVRSTAH